MTKTPEQYIEELRKLAESPPFKQHPKYLREVIKMEKELKEKKKNDKDTKTQSL